MSDQMTSLSNTIYARPYMIDEESTKTLVKLLEGNTATRSEELNHKLLVASQTTKKNQGKAACTARMPN